MLEELDLTISDVLHVSDISDIFDSTKEQLKCNFLNFQNEDKSSLMYSEDYDKIQIAKHQQKHQIQQMVRQSLKKVGKILNLDKNDEIYTEHLLNTIQFTQKIQQNKLTLKQEKKSQLENELKQIEINLPINQKAFKTSKWRDFCRGRRRPSKVTANARILLKSKLKDIQVHQDENKKSIFSDQNNGSLSSKVTVIKNKYQNKANTDRQRLPSIHKTNNKELTPVKTSKIQPKQYDPSKYKAIQPKSFSCYIPNDNTHREKSISNIFNTGPLKQKFNQMEPIRNRVSSHRIKNIINKYKKNSIGPK